MLEIPAYKKQTLAAVPNIEKFNRQNTKFATAATICAMPIIRAAPLLPKNDSTKQIAVVTTGNIDQTLNPAAVFAWLSVCIVSCAISEYAEAQIMLQLICGMEIAVPTTPRIHGALLFWFALSIIRQVIFSRIFAPCKCTCLPLTICHSLPRNADNPQLTTGSR